jgi:hypothetical protein
MFRLGLRLSDLTGPAVAMAVVATCTIPEIPTNPTMYRIGFRLRVATGADKDRVVGRVCVAIAAKLSRVVRDRKPCVVKGRAGPCCCRMAGLAGGRESRSGVIRIRCACILRTVA